MRQPPLTPPATQGPADGGVDPQSPPATEPPGAEGAIRSTPCGPTGPPKINAAVVDDASSGGGQWVTIGRVAGNCGAISAPATIAGFDTRLVYRSDAAQFQVFLIDQSDPNSSGGFADVECRTACADEQDLTDPAGRYQLKVAATDAPWEVLLQEYR